MQRRQTMLVNRIATLFRIDGQPVAAAVSYAWRCLHKPSTLAAIPACAIESRSRGCAHVALRVGSNVRAVAATLVEEVVMGLQHRRMLPDSTG